MKRYIPLLLILMIFLNLLAACNNEKKQESEKQDFGKIFYVATTGDDNNDGTKNSPLATIGGAVTKIHEYRKTNGLPENGIKVEFSAGTYKVTEQTNLTKEDSGTADSPVVFAAEEGAEVIFDGGISLSSSDFVPANDDFKAILLSDEAKANVLEANLANAGIWDADDSQLYSSGWSADVYRQSLYVNNELKTVARWPNDSYYTPEQIKTNAVTEDGTSYGYIYISEEKANLWKNCKHISFYGYPCYDWSARFVWNIKCDSEQSALLYPMNVDYGLSSTCHFYVFNIPQELDEPGEYYWDVEANKLYYWPEEDLSNAKINFSQFKDSVFYLENTEYITFEGLTFENLRYRAIYSKNSSGSNNITISNCVFRCITAAPISIFGNHNTINANEFYNLGGGAICAEGGDIATQATSDTIISNNIMHDWSQVYTINNPGVDTTGFGFVISHNEFYDAPHEAILFSSGATIIEYNHIHDVCKETSDAGSIYVGRRWDWGNSEIRYNYIHDIIDVRYSGSPNAIYLDDTAAKISCYGNIIVNVAGRAFALGGGRNLTIYNNILVNTSGICLDGRGYGWYPSVTSYPDGYLWTCNVNANLHTDIWRYTQPEYLSVLEMRTTEELSTLRGIVSDILDSPAPPSYADIYGNIGYNNEGASVLDRTSYIFNRNRYLALNNSEDGSSPNGPLIVDPAYTFGKIADNIEYIESQLNDIFEDPENGNFFLKEDSRVYRDIFGFEKWDYSLIGIQK